MREGVVLGVDIGGSGVKGAPVDLVSGRMLTERLRIPTPSPAEPDAVAGVVADIARHFEWRGPIGCTFPGVTKAGTIHTAVNLTPSWVGRDAAALFADTTGCTVTVMNDADAAGLAEMQLGAGRGRRDVVVVLTLGTGIGSALFSGGALVPNTELGHLELRGGDAESFAAARVRDELGLSWKRYAKRVNEYLHLVERALWPDLIIIGGGVSAKADRWFGHLETRAELLPAELANRAGIVGAALWAAGRPRVVT